MIEAAVVWAFVAVGSPAEAAVSGPATDPGAGPQEARRATSAIGHGGHTPLPSPPAPEDPSTVANTPWRGWVAVELGGGLGGGVAGPRPGRSTRVSAYGRVGASVRLHRVVALGAAATTFVHDSDRRAFVDEATGETLIEEGVGRVTLADLAVLRVLWPATGRVEPFLRVGGGLGVRRRPLTGRADFAGTVRAGAGVDFWLSPTLTLDVNVGYRAIFVRRVVGHDVQGGLGLSFHI